MLYKFQSPFGSTGKMVPAGRAVQFEPSDRDAADVSRGLTPEHVDRILLAANTGDIRDQARLAQEIEEKNWDIAQALQTRRLAVAGLEWDVQPGDDSAQAKTIAADFEQVLRTPQYEPQDADIQTFDQAMVYALMSALLPGFATVEILWGQGGKTIAGFVDIPQRHFTFQNGSRTPLLVTTQQPLGIELPAQKLIYHRCFSRSGDATRGGLIRPLAWLDVFQRLGGFKDLLRFVERYGMPFLVAKVNQQAWEKDRSRLKYLIRNFGSDGGAVFTDAVTTELLQAANNQGDVYFRLLEYTGEAIEKIILGQTATSGDAGGLSKGQAQENVRRDLVAADARAIDATITSRLISLWVQWNYGPNAPVPRMHHQVEEAEDLKLTSEVLVNLKNAGFQADEKEVSDRFGFTLSRMETAAPPAAPTDAMMAAAETAGKRVAAAAALAAFDPDHVAGMALEKFLSGRGLEDWFGPLQTAISVALRGEPDEAEVKRRMNRLLSQVPELMQAMDPAEFERFLSDTIFTAAVGGMAAKAAKLK